MNDSRYSGQSQGFYESFFQRANHPHRPLAFWIRYTIFSPKAHPERALGELWAIFFNGETGKHVALKREFPFRRCHFDRSQFSVTIDNARLSPTRLCGHIKSEEHGLTWDLDYHGDDRPLLLLPLWMYPVAFPPAKTVVGMPMAHYSGTLTIDGVVVDVRDWVGSQNHNWGIKHTDSYSWAQVAGFDSHPESFLEMASARMKIRGVWMPTTTIAVLRHRGKEYAFNSLYQALRARSSLQSVDDAYVLRFRCKQKQMILEGTVSAPHTHFVELTYYNPPGGMKYCLNSKIAACTVRLTDTHSKRSETLVSRHRAAFEIMSDANRLCNDDGFDVHKLSNTKH